MNVQASVSAQQHIKKCLTKRGGGLGLRISVKESGCSGLRYVFDFVDNFEATDKIFPIEGEDGMSIAIAKEAYPYVKGSVLDYRKEGLNSKLVIENPNQTGSCGCGESFTVS